MGMLAYSVCPSRKVHQGWEACGQDAYCLLHVLLLNASRKGCRGKSLILPCLLYSSSGKYSSMSRQFRLWWMYTTADSSQPYQSMILVCDNWVHSTLGHFLRPHPATIKSKVALKRPRTSLSGCSFVHLPRHSFCWYQIRAKMSRHSQSFFVSLPSLPTLFFFFFFFFLPPSSNPLILMLLDRGTSWHSPTG